VKTRDENIIVKETTWLMEICGCTTTIIK